MKKHILAAAAAAVMAVTVAGPAAAMPKIFGNGKACVGHGNPKLRELPQQARAGEADRPPWCSEAPD